MENVFVPPEQFGAKLGSKMHLYNICKVTLDFYLPPYNKTSLEFLRSLLSKAKKAVLKGDLKKVDVPMQKELSVVAVWPQIKELNDVKDYFLDLIDGQLPDREFMWNILHTLKQMTTKSLINNVLEGRGLANEESKDNMVEIAPEYLEKLMEVAVKKNVKGRAAFFLRKSAKLKRNRAPAKIYRANYDLFRVECNALENIIRERERPKSRDRDNNVVMEEEEKEHSPRRGRWGGFPRLDFDQSREDEDDHSV